MKNKATQKSSQNSRKQKHIVALYHLYRVGHKGLNTFEAKVLYGDTCLHSTISTLVHDYSFQIPRKSEYVGESPRPFSRYWLCESDRAKAESLLLIHYGDELQCA